MKLPTILGIALPTLAYWFWESRAGGNIRIDLLLIYPILFVLYAGLLWSKLRWVSLAVTLLLMVVNFGFFMFSYSWFNKSLG